jgi:uncharacterized membrane protein YeaQ/YmgE (transglycosylase-associated protein family)
MGFLWFLVIGLIVGLLAGTLTKNTDLGKFGNILIGIIGALTADYFLYSLGMSAKFNTFWNLIFAIIGSLVFLILMKKLSKSF